MLDGGLGTELERRGVSLAGPAWSARALEEAQGTVLEVHRDYAAAGADVITANTFRTQRRRVGARWEELARRGVELARAGGGASARVAGSLGPLEDCYRPDLSPGASGRLEHRELARALAAAGVDLLLCETFANPVEAAVAVEEAARTGLEVWVALTAGPTGELMSRGGLREAGRACASAGASAVLVNCTPAAMTLSFVEAARESCARVGAYANAGAPEEGLGWAADVDAAADRYLQLADRWVAAGASLLGGCCGTGPAHVRRLAERRATQRTLRTSTRP